MDSAAIITAFLTGVAGLIAFFFGRQYWGVLSGLITSQAKEIERLQELTRHLRDRLDTLEEKCYQKDLQLQETMSALDNYIVSSQAMLLENHNLRLENACLTTKLNELLKSV